MDIEKCRALLSMEMQLSDTEVEELRDLLYSTANLAFEVYWSDSNTGSKNPFRFLPDSNPVDIV